MSRKKRNRYHLLAFILAFTLTFSNMSGYITPADTIPNSSESILELCTEESSAAESTAFSDALSEHSSPHIPAFFSAAKNTSLSLTSDMLLSEAASRLGANYIWGGKGQGYVIPCWSSLLTPTPAGRTPSCYSNGYDCSGLIYDTMSHLCIAGDGSTGSASGVNGLPMTTDDWISSYGSNSGVLTLAYNGSSVTISPLGTYTGDAFKAHLESGAFLPGDIIVAYGPGMASHVFFYFGKFVSREAVIRYLTERLGIPHSIANANTIDNGTSWGNGTYWRIEAHGSETHQYASNGYKVQIDNSWGGKAEVMPYYEVWRMPITISDPPPSQGTLTFSKTGTHTGTPISNAVFTLYSDTACTHPIGITLTTDESGNASIMLDAGTYYAKETTTPTGYHNTNTIWTLTVSADEETHISVCNDEWYTTISLEKQNTYTHEKLSGAIFKLYEWSRTSDQYKEVGTFRDAGNGVYIIDSYNVGNSSVNVISNGTLYYTDDNTGLFKIIETTAPEHYKADFSYELNISNDIKTFPLIANNEPSVGELKILKTGDDGTYLSGARFGVYTSADKAAAATTQNPGTSQFLTTGTDGCGIITLSTGTYYLKELISPAGFELDTRVYGPYTVESNPSQNTIHEISNTRSKGILKVFKNGQTFNQITSPLKNAVFAVYASKELAEAGTINNQNTATAIITTDADGYAETNLLPFGKYWVKEIQAPEGYQLDETVYGGNEGFLVGGNPKDIEVLAATNTLLSGCIELYKQGIGTDGNPKPLGNAVFGIYSSKDAAESAAIEDTSSAVAAITTDIHGYSVSKELPAGYYWIRELQAPSGYMLDSTVYGGAAGFAVGGKSAKVTVTINDNIPAPGKITLTKYGTDSAGDRVKLKGAVFSIFDTLENAESNETALAVTTITTDKTGFAVTDELPAGRYWVRELQSPDGYNLDNTIYGGENGILVGWNLDTVHVPVNDNIPSKGQIELIKKGINEYEEMTFLSGAVFGIYNSMEAAVTGTYDTRDTAVTTVTTNHDGKAITKALEAGIYYIKEIKAPKGYRLDDTVYTLLTGWTHNLVRVTVNENIPCSGTLSVYKSGITTDGTTSPLKGAIFGIYTSLNAAVKGTIDLPTTAASIITTDENGCAISVNLPADYYWVKELKAPDGYQLSDTIYGGDSGILLGWTMQQVKVQADDNIPNQGQLTLVKTGVDINGKKIPLSNAVFGVYASLETAQAGTNLLPNAVTLLTTDNEGTAITPLIDCGIYYIKELQAPNGYLLDETIYGPYEVGNMHEFVTVDIAENIPKPGVISIEKTDSITGHLLSGAFYTVYTDSECTKEAAQIIIENGIGSVEVAYGIYYIKETTVPYGYQLDETIYGPFAVGGPEGDPQTLQIAEKEQKIEISLTKQDLETGNIPQGNATFKGAVFELRAAEDIIHPDGHTGVVYKKGDVAATLITDSDGNASVSKDSSGNWLHCGIYELIETKAPDGYVLDQTPVFIHAIYDAEQYAVPIVSHTAGIIADQVIRQSVRIHKITDQDTKNPLSAIGFTFYLLTDVLEANECKTYYDLPIDEYGSIDVSQLNLEGLEAVIGENGETELFTDTDGYLQTVPLLYGEYMIVETTSNPYYEASGPVIVRVPTVMNITGEDPNTENKVEVYDIDYLPDQPLEITIVNTTLYSHLLIEKRDYEEGTLICKNPTAFQIYDANGDPVVQSYWNGHKEIRTDTFYTNNDGYLHTWEPLSSGEYTVIEIAPPTGYVASEPIHFIIDTNSIRYIYKGIEYPCKLGYTYDGETIATAVVYDNPITVEFTKTDIETGKNIEDAELTVYTRNEDGSRGDIAVYYDSTGTYYPAIWTTTEEKHIINRLPTGSYLLAETTAPVWNGYVTSDDIPFDVIETPDMQTVNIENDFTKVSISKTDIATGEEIVGASLKIVDSDNTTIAEWISDGTPYYIERLPVGIYTLIEVQTPTWDGYVHSEDVEFIIEDTPEIQKVDMKDDFTRFVISKIDITTGNELPGAELTLKDKDGTIIDQWISTDEPHYVERLIPKETYTLTEEYSPDGYFLAETIEFTVLETGEIQTVSMLNDTTKVRISKQDITTGTELPGAELILKDIHGTVVDQWISTTEPHYIEGILTAGATYTLTEITAPNGYKIAESISFTVSNNGCVDTITMYDEKIISRRPSETQILGVENNSWMTALLCLTLSLIFAGLSLYIKRKYHSR